MIILIVAGAIIIDDSIAVAHVHTNLSWEGFEFDSNN